MRRFGLMMAMSLVLLGSAANAQCLDLNALNLPDEWFIQGDRSVVTGYGGYGYPAGTGVSFAPRGVSSSVMYGSPLLHDGRTITSPVLYDNNFGFRNNRILDLQGPAGIRFGL